VSLPLKKEQELQPPTPTKGRKEVIYTRILQGETFPAYPSLRKTARAPGEKNTKS
jgi:hypothetical protein